MLGWLRRRAAEVGALPTRPPQKALAYRHTSDGLFRVIDGPLEGRRIEYIGQRFFCTLDGELYPGFGELTYRLVEDDYNDEFYYVLWGDK